jgi:hypothetical protein
VGREPTALLAMAARGHDNSSDDSERGPSDLSADPAPRYTTRLLRPFAPMFLCVMLLRFCLLIYGVSRS